MWEMFCFENLRKPTDAVIWKVSREIVSFQLGLSAWPCMSTDDRVSSNIRIRPFFKSALGSLLISKSHPFCLPINSLS